MVWRDGLRIKREELIPNGCCGANPMRELVVSASTLPPSRRVGIGGWGMSQRHFVGRLP
jgi:hypothetical protein